MTYKCKNLLESETEILVIPEELHCLYGLADVQHGVPLAPQVVVRVDDPPGIQRTSPRGIENPVNSSRVSDSSKNLPMTKTPDLSMSS